MDGITIHHSEDRSLSNFRETVKDMDFPGGSDSEASAREGSGYVMHLSAHLGCSLSRGMFQPWLHTGRFKESQCPACNPDPLN